MTDTYQIKQYVIKSGEIPAILVTSTQIVKHSIEPDFKRFLTLKRPLFIQTVSRLTLTASDTSP